MSDYYAALRAHFKYLILVRSLLVEHVANMQHYRPQRAELFEGCFVRTFL